MHLSLTHLALVLGASQKRLFQFGLLPILHHLKDNLCSSVSVLTAQPSYCCSAVPVIASSLGTAFQAENTLVRVRLSFIPLLRQLANTGEATQINTVKTSNGYRATQNQFRM